MRELCLDEIKQIELNVLREIHAFCEKNHLQYVLWAGTLLGAIRHNGFIPWDDDIDIIMPRKDYDYFVRHFGSERYGVKSCETDNLYPNTYAKAYDKTTYKKEKAICLKESLQIGVDVDVFPVDLCPKGDLKRGELFIRRLLTRLRLAASIPYKNEKSFSNICKNAAIFFVKEVCRLSPNKIARKINIMAQRRQHGDLVYYADANDLKPLYIPNDCFTRRELHQFEENQYFISTTYDELLTICYGDYMQLPPEEKRVAHHDFDAYRYEDNAL